MLDINPRLDPGATMHGNHPQTRFSNRPCHNPDLPRPHTRRTIPRTSLMQIILHST
jgi:hypothetical protein